MALCDLVGGTATKKESYMKASDLFVKCLEEEGIEYIFGVPGEENADFMMSLEKSKKKFHTDSTRARRRSHGGDLRSFDR